MINIIKFNLQFILILIILAQFKFNIYYIPSKINYVLNILFYFLIINNN